MKKIENFDNKNKEKIIYNNERRSIFKNSSIFGIKKQESAITLIALVITIVVLLILAGVSINAVIGENGIISKAKEGKIKTEIASIKEEIQIDIIGKQAENDGNISDDSLKEILEKYGTLSDEEKLTDKTLTTTEGNY